MNAKKMIYAMTSAVLLTSLSGCGVYKQYQTPDSTPLTSAYTQVRAVAPDSAAFGNLLWEDVFTDPILAGFIDTALSHNTSLVNAQSNVAIAQAQLDGARLSYLPSLSLVPNGAGSSYAGSDISWTYSIPAAVSWEADIFGKLLNSKRGAQAALYQSEAYAQAVRSQIICGVARCYYTIAATKRQIQLYNTTSQLWGETVSMMKDLKEAGRVTEAAVVQQTANYYSILGGVKDLEVQLNQLYNTMSLLLNVMPQQWDVPAEATLSLPVKLDDGVPMSALAWRPDVAAAEYALASAFYATGSAKAAFYPGLTISAQGGFTNLLGSFIQNPGDWFVQLAGQVTAPIFARGQNITRLKAAKEKQQQALNSFEYQLLSAAAEVHNGLVVYQKAVEKSECLTQQIYNLEKSVSYTSDLLLYGNGTYLEVITAQQSLLNAQMSALSTDIAIIQSIINIYQSMGGGR